MQSNLKKQKVKSKKIAVLKGGMRTRSTSGNFKSDQAACEFEQTTAKKIKNNNNVSPILIEETPNPIIEENNKIICEEVVKDLLVCEFNENPYQIVEEQETENLCEFMREQLKYEEGYECPKIYLENQCEIQCHMVAILFDWLIEVAHSFNFKRETFYLAMNYVERYLSRQANILLSKFQLLGVTSMFVAHKCEEIYPKPLKDFQRLTQDQYTIKDIEDMEVSILCSLEFKMNPNTPIFWLNYYTKKWDEFILEKGCTIFLKERTNDSYIRYREIVQIFDFCLIDYKYKQKDKLTALSLIYLVVGKWLRVPGFEYEQIVFSCSEINDYLRSNSKYNLLFTEFLENAEIYLNFDQKIIFEDLNEVVCDVLKYFRLKMDNTLPKILYNNQEFLEELQYEELLSFQTYNKNMIEALNEISKST